MGPRLLRGAAVVAGLSVALALLTYVASTLLPRSYESQALVSVTVSGQVLSNQLVTSQLLSNLPAPAALAQAFTQLMVTRALSTGLGTDRPDKIYEAKFDEKKGLLTLRANGRTRAEAKQRAEKLLEIAQTNLQDRLTDAARANARSALEQARIDIKTAARILDDVRQVLRGAPRIAAAPGVAAGLEALKVDPAIARSPNPSFTYLSLQEAQQQATLAQARARAEALEGVLNEPNALRKLVGQALQVQVLAPPAEPILPVSPQPMRNGGLAGFATASLGALVLFFREGLETRQSPTA
ncbi:MAG TPA: lipopolysaccharide biosynthesis protein [Thermoanaerobaculia bacterium]|nr:lipopolysaccharide biosynthesis protein [Thermoanaerobaculia bacterium]